MITLAELPSIYELANKSTMSNAMKMSYKLQLNFCYGHGVAGCWNCMSYEAVNASCNLKGVQCYDYVKTAKHFQMFVAYSRIRCGDVTDNRTCFNY